MPEISEKLQSGTFVLPPGTGVPFWTLYPHLILLWVLFAPGQLKHP